jgi:two-component system response regulator PilR (NtrC family)
MKDGIPGNTEKDEVSLPEIIEGMEKEYIVEALEKTKWHRENAAKLLGITRKMLGDRISKYDLRKTN